MKIKNLNFDYFNSLGHKLRLCIQCLKDHAFELKTTVTMVIPLVINEISLEFIVDAATGMLESTFFDKLAFVHPV